RLESSPSIASSLFVFPQRLQGFALSTLRSQSRSLLSSKKLSESEQTLQIEELGSMSKEGKLLTGKEVPFISSDAIKWTEVSVEPRCVAGSGSSSTVAPPTEDAGSCCVLWSPPTYLVWRIHKDRPNALELLEFCAQEQLPRVGLRIIFREDLSPFAYIFENVRRTPRYPYMLYALSVSGVAYCFQLRNVSEYTPSLGFSPDEMLFFEIQNSFGPITAIAATSGCLVVGREDGSVSCFQLGLLDSNAPGFMHHLRDDAALTRLWSFVSRGRSIGSIKDVRISDVQNKKLVFVLHSDSNLQVWDLFGREKILSHYLHVPGTIAARMWVGEFSHDSNAISLAVMHKQTLEVNVEGIYTYVADLKLGDSISLLLNTSDLFIPLTERELVDVRLTSDKVWVLKEDGLFGQDLCGPNRNMGWQFYALHEEFVADQLFQTSKHSLDLLFEITGSIFCNAKAQMLAFISSIFLHRLLHLGLQNTGVLRATLADYNKQWTDSEFHGLSVEDLRRKILSLIEQEALSGSTFSIFKCWSELCMRYFKLWCKRNKPHGLLVDSLSGSIGLIRKDSFSLFRCLEDIELLVHGAFNDFDDLKSGLVISGDSDEKRILVEVLLCCRIFGQHFGSEVASLFYQSAMSFSMISVEDLVHHLLKGLRSGCNYSLAKVDASEQGIDLVHQNLNAAHKELRGFSVDMLVSLHGLCSKANGWDKILHAIEYYLNYLVPSMSEQSSESGKTLNVITSVVIQATPQIAGAMFECALEIMLFLNYLISFNGQICMPDADVIKVKLELIPMVHGIIVKWLLIYIFSTTPAQSLAEENFSLQLSSLQIDGNTSKPRWMEKINVMNFTLDYVLILNANIYSPNWKSQYSSCLPSPWNLTSMVKNFISWRIRGPSGKGVSHAFGHLTELALVLLRHGQYNAVEILLKIVIEHLKNENHCNSIQSEDGGWCLLHHLLGCSLIAQTQGRSKNKEKINEAVRCFFRASSGENVADVLQRLPSEGWPQLAAAVTGSNAVWRLNYYQWVMQLFELYNTSEAAYDFALAALEQVDEAMPHDSCGTNEITDESASAVRGRLWANIFKFTLDLGRYYDAYCAIISNPDEESKCICLRRFIIVLCERGATKILCDGELPFVGLTEKMERELACKAACSDILLKPNFYKLLYAYEMQQQNWRKAASYIYLYSAKLVTEAANSPSLALQERLNGISAAINALHLVHPTCAWIDLQISGSLFLNESNPSKTLKIDEEQSSSSGVQALTHQSFVDIKRLENEFVLASAEYLLLSANVPWIPTGNKTLPSDLVNLLVKKNLYDMAFTIILRFWKGSGQKRELERVFSAMSLKCCNAEASSPLSGSNGFLLKSSVDDPTMGGAFDTNGLTKHPISNTLWEMLEVYLDKYKALHARLPAVVADTLLGSDRQIELPRWLVNMFKGMPQERTLGMTSQDCDVASLFRLYVDYGRYKEAADLLVEYIDAYESTRPVDLIHRKRPFAAWFPYTAIERLWCKLEESIHSGHMVQQSEKLKNILLGALRSHLQLLKKDSEDALSSVMG
ncbi:hypothetical protein Drorol1_Dr00027564, partial [Drosera rotundifolia]